MHRDRVSRHSVLGGTLAVKRAAGQAMLDQLDGANLDNALATQRIKAGRLGV